MKSTASCRRFPQAAQVVEARDVDRLALDRSDKDATNVLVVLGDLGKARVVERHAHEPETSGSNPLHLAAAGAESVASEAAMEGFP